MRLVHFLDVSVIVLWLALTLGAGIFFSRRASQSADDFFVTDRSLPWWVVGTSMVATTFAADTPLLVSGYVAGGGIGANWAWWFSGIGGIVGVFLFARLWRRSGVVTDAELVELRYGGSAARFLRGLKAIWFGVFMNVLVIGWVMGAMRKLSRVILGLGPDAMLVGVPADSAIVVVLFFAAVVYTGSSGLWGVIATDLIQFALAMLGAIGLAVVSWQLAGGRAGIRRGMEEHGFDWATQTAMVPEDPATFAVLIGVIWWAARNVDGGGYIAQRMFAAKDERHALWAYLWFVIAHICVRPWPWIIVGLAGMAILPTQEDPELYYPMMMVEALPPGFFGLMVASFLAAFMSTIDTQLNWGASLLINDLYRRFLAPGREEQHYVFASRVAVLGIAILGAGAGLYIDSLAGAWELAVAVTAGVGAVYVARWYWWRVNAWSELAAMVVGAVCTFSWPETWAFPWNALATVCVSVPVWVLVTALTPEPDEATLRAFYERVRPGGPGWRIARKWGYDDPGPGLGTLLGILGGIAGLYAILLGIGGAILARYEVLLVSVVVAVLGVGMAARQVLKETT